MPKTKNSASEFNYKIGDVVEYHAGKRIGKSYGKILRIMKANVRLLDMSFYNVERYVQKENISGHKPESVEENIS